jgi:hypothetical protein
MVTDEQVKVLRRVRMKGKTQETAAAKAGMSVRTARCWEKGMLPSGTKKAREWRTRKNPFEEVWPEVVKLLTQDTKGKLQAKTIFKELRRRHPDRFDNGQLRTLQRRVRDWRALNGLDKVVMFPQAHPPGREGAFDFTHCTELGVTIGGVLLIHLLFVFRLSFSGCTWVQLAFGETFEAMVSGVQGALWELDGATEVVRHDNLSAATHELRKGGGRSLNKRFKDVLDHYGLKSTRIRPGESHENGIVEKGNHMVKTALEQALLLRGHRDFVTQAAYMVFVRKVVADELNADVALEEERAHLKPLPPAPVPSYTLHEPTVRSWSTIRVGGRAYSVPSRLIGHKLTVRQHADVVEVNYKGQLVETMPRLRGSVETRIDYRHIIGSLIRKPGAFARYRFREDLFPSLVFRMAYDAIKQWRGDRADIEYVRILHLAARTMEALVETALQLLLESGQRFDYVAVKELAEPEKISAPTVYIAPPNLKGYDQLLAGLR